MGKYSKTIATDSLQNLIASVGSGTDRLGQTRFIPDQFYGSEELAAIYMGWLGRRIVDLPIHEALKKGWQVFCPSWTPEKIQILNSYTNIFLNLPQKLSEALKSARIFGGSLIVAMVDSRFGGFSNPIPDFLPSKSLLGIQFFDAWQAYPAQINLTNPLSKTYRYPETYTIGAAGIAVNVKGEEEFLSGTLVHHTRVHRFDGKFLPWYSRQRNFYWHQSVLANAYESVRNAKLVDNSIASLIFRASVPILKVTDLAGIVSDPEAKAAFMDRVNLMNYGMSNNNMGIIDAEETLENFEAGAITNLDSILERFYVTVSTATGIPVTKLIGESARGLNATGEGDLNNYYDMLEDIQNTDIRPPLIDMYKRWIIPSLFNELMPQDFEIRFPDLERISPDKKQEKDNTYLSMIQSALDAGLIDKKVARREILEAKIFSNFSKEDIDRIESDEGENNVGLDAALDAYDLDFSNRDFCQRLKDFVFSLGESEMVYRQRLLSMFDAIEKGEDLNSFYEQEDLMDFLERKNPEIYQELMEHEDEFCSGE